jgi:hypothetical protein
MAKVKGGSEVQDKNPIDWLIWKRPNPEWSSFQFRETLTHWALRWGNGYAEIERDSLGRPFALWPIHPERVKVCRDPDTGVLYYEVSNGTGGADRDSPPTCSTSGASARASSASTSSTTPRSRSAGPRPRSCSAPLLRQRRRAGVVVKNKKGSVPDGLKLSAPSSTKLFKGPSARTRLGASRQRCRDRDDRPQRGRDAAYRVHQFLVEEICRWFGVPPHKVMHLLRATFSNIEHQAIEVVVDCISPWVKRFEDEADFKLFGQNRRNLYTKMNMNALLRGDMKSRMEFYKGMQFVGAYSPNDILELEDENTIGPDGDIHVMQQQISRTSGTA